MRVDPGAGSCLLGAARARCSRSPSAVRSTARSRRADRALWGGLVRIFLLHHVTWSINSVCHFFGTRRFAIEDHSTNVFWLALLSLGEAWHHNHHAFPRSANHGLRCWELDPSAWVIRAMKRLGLAWNVVEITPERQRRSSPPDHAVTCMFVQERADTPAPQRRAPAGDPRERWEHVGKVVAARLVRRARRVRGHDPARPARARRPGARPARPRRRARRRPRSSARSPTSTRPAGTRRRSWPAAGVELAAQRARRAARRLDHEPRARPPPARRPAPAPC